MLKIIFDYLGNAGSPAWAVRRRIVIACIIFNFGLIIWASQWMRIETAPIIINQAYMFLTFVVGYYVFGPIVDDFMKRKGGTVQVPAPDTEPQK